MKRPKPMLNGLIHPMWREIDGDGRVFEPWETAILLDAQDRAVALVASSRSLTAALRAHIANTVLKVARRSQTRDGDLDADAIAATAAETVLGIKGIAGANGHAIPRTDAHGITMSQCVIAGVPRYGMR